MAKITIDGKEIQAEDGKTLLEVIRENNLGDVPTLCHSDILPPFTSCFLCVADVKGARRLEPSCATKIVDGMEVSLENERVFESRKTNLELLLSNHHADCYPPCRLKCPANMDVQGYIALANRGLYDEGHRLLKETNPLPMVCGRVCARPCEDNCRRQYVDEAVDIKNIKRFMADRDLNSDEMYIPGTGTDTGKKIAVIGAGPAGLSAAFYLRKYGHAVTMFERLPAGGGMLRYGIPEYRLPKADLQKEIDAIEKMGAKIEYNKELGRDFTIESLMKGEFDAVFLGIGAQLGSSSRAKGEDLEGVMQGVEFLLDVNLGKDVDVKGDVFVIGGGNTAIDAARSALRCGARSVTIVYRRTEAEMPAHNEEIEDAKDEGIKIEVLNAPVEYIGENGRLKKVRLQKMELGEPDESGRRRPVPVEGSEYEADVDYVIAAIGQKVDTSCLDGVDISKWNTIEADEELFTTSREGVFAGGDAVTGPDIAIAAIAHGRKAALSIDNYLNGKEMKKEDRLGFHIRKEDFAELTEDDFKDRIKLARNHMEKLPPRKRKNTFEEVELGFTEDELRKETFRCLECGCQDIYECKLKEYSQRYNVDKTRFIGGDYRENLYDSKQTYIDVNTEKCITCGQCVRLCSMVQKQAVFTFNKRGFDSTPVPYMFKAMDDTNCITCGLCVTGCPVGAITEKSPKGQKPGPFENRLTETHCNLCGDGCRMVIETRDGNFIKITSKIKNREFFDNLCKRGRFGYEMFTMREMLDTGGKPEADISKFIQNLKGDSTVVSVSPVLTIEEIDQVTTFAQSKKIPLYSFELGNDLDKIRILKEAGVAMSGASDDEIGRYTDIYYFGSFDEDHNSVSFRKLIRQDKKQRIHLSIDMPKSYFEYRKYGSDDEMFNEMSKNYNENTLIAFNLQKTGVETVGKLATFLSEKSIKNYAVLNNYPNYSYLLVKLADIETIKKNIEDKMYGTLVAVNSDEGFINGSFKETLFFSDRDISMKADYFIPINSIYEKSGKIVDQWGREKQLIKSAKESAFSIKQFLG